uniref:G_PROTEIN_RECEP_F3_4 domain-containing protein n=1 Tax=Parastrongyloides trichosuri TaxID=131310 RepID=A0A0N4ZA57_PARTI
MEDIYEKNKDITCDSTVSSPTTLTETLEISPKWTIKCNDQYNSIVSLTSPQTVSSSAHLFNDHDDNDSTKDSFSNYIIKNNSGDFKVTHHSLSLHSRSLKKVKNSLPKDNKEYSKAAYSHFVSCLTVLYAMLAIVYSIVQETVQQSDNTTWQAEMKNLLAPSSHHGEGAGSLYLRLGIIFFGSAGIILFFLEIMLCFTCENCLPHSLINLILAGLFTFLQMHFIFCNSKVVVSKQKNIAKLGTMHLLAVNIWTWFRMVLAKKNKGKVKKISVENGTAINITGTTTQSSVINLIERYAPSSFDLLAGSSVQTFDDVINNSSTINNGTNDTNILSSINMIEENMVEFLTTTINTMINNSTKINEQHEMISIPSSISSSIKFRSYPNNNVLGKITAYEYFGDFTTFVITCIVEYSVIGAAIMFVIWKSLSEENDLESEMDSFYSFNNDLEGYDDKHRSTTDNKYICKTNSIPKSNSKERSSVTIASQASFHKTIITAKRKNRVSIDCSASSSGLFCGLLFLICCFVSVLMYCVFYQQNKNDSAIHVFRISDLIMFTIMLFSVVVGLTQMKQLSYDIRKIKRTNSEFLDDILLGVGLVGEQIYSCIGIIVWIGVWYKKEEGNTNDTSLLLPVQSLSSNFNINTLAIFVFITRIIESTLQALFILVISRMKALSESAKLKKPGKQFVTFLLIANVSLFFFHTLEGMKCIFGYTESSTSSDTNKSNLNVENYLSLVYAVSPLVIFFRFHSSVCLAEIWKHCYSEKDHHHQENMHLYNSNDDNLNNGYLSFENEQILSILPTNSKNESNLQIQNSFSKNDPNKTYSEIFNDQSNFNSSVNKIQDIETYIINQ